MTIRTFGFAIATLILTWGCGKGSVTLTEVQREKSGGLDVVILSPHGAVNHGHDAFVVEFRSENGALVDVGDVKANATMPMPGMPMIGGLDVKKTSTPGRYDVDATFDMAGTWRTTIEWNGPSGAGSASFSGTVQ